VITVFPRVWQKAYTGWGSLAMSGSRQGA